MQTRISTAAWRHWRKGAVVTAIAASAVAFSGTGVAVAHGLVDSDRIQNQTIRQIDVGPAGVGGAVGKGDSELAKETLDHRNIADNGVRPWDLGDNFQADATSELEGYEVIGFEDRFTAGSHEVTASCPGGKVAVGGGYQASADGAGGANTHVFAADYSDVTQTGDGSWQAMSYTVGFDNSEATSADGMGNMRVRVVCADQG